MCHFKVAQFLSLFNVIKTKRLSVSPTVTKDGREGERGRHEREESLWANMRESVQEAELIVDDQNIYFIHLSSNVAA